MSAVIYAAIVVMWAVVLVPMWLRRHDDKVESRSVDRFSTAMRTLSRRSHATPGRRYVVMPRRQGGALSVHVSGAAASARPVPPSAAERRAAMVARRRRTFLGLLGLVGLTFLLAVAGAFPWLLQVLVDLLLVGFVVHLRKQAPRAATVSRQRSRDAAAPVTRPADRPLQPAVPVEPIVPAPVVAEADVTWSDDVEATGTWEPVPVPRPTYTMKPPAPPMPATAQDESPVAADGDGGIGELDEILEPRWAVND